VVPNKTLKKQRCLIRLVGMVGDRTTTPGELNEFVRDPIPGGKQQECLVYRWGGMFSCTKLRIFIENIAITSLMGDRLTANSNRVAVERVKSNETIGKVPLVCQTSKGNNASPYRVFFVFNRYPEVEWKRGKNTMSSDWEKLWIDIPC